MNQERTYLAPALRYVAIRYDQMFLVSTEGGSSIDDATEEEWTL